MTNLTGPIGTEVEAIAELTFHEVPESLNDSMYADRWHRRRLKQYWQEQLGLMLMVEKLPRGLQRVEAAASMRFRVRRERDEGNFSWLLEKSLGDALKNGGWLQDDTHDRYRFVGVTFVEETGTPLTIVTVTGFKAVPSA